MKMKIEASEGQISQIEQRIEVVIDKLQRHLSDLEEEREGDFWRMSSHEPNPQKVSEIVRNVLNVLTSGFKDIRDFTFEFSKSEDNE